MTKKETTILLSVGELWLKGANRRDFVAQLKRNIRATAAVNAVEIVETSSRQARLLCRCYGEEKNVFRVFDSVCGVSRYAPVEVLPPKIEALEEAVDRRLSHLRDRKIKTVAFETKRSDKAFPLTSPQINARLGELAGKYGLRVDYKGAAERFVTVVEAEEIFFAGGWRQGPGGLPVGTSGRVLLLFSGGIDSPVAAYRLLRRGCRVDYVHFHSLPNNEAVVNSKITEIIKILNTFGGEAKLFVLPYLTFDLAINAARIKSRTEVVMFKNFMHRLAAHLASEHGYEAVANGDNLAQVASQTIWNMRAGSYAVDALLLRPLLAADKTDIIDEARRIGTYEQSLVTYKDCCSLTAKNPRTGVNISSFKKDLENFPLRKVIEETLAQMSVYQIAANGKVKKIN